jgi:hypothetical protein
MQATTSAGDTDGTRTVPEGSPTVPEALPCVYVRWKYSA